MRSFSMIEFANRSEKVLDAADEAPVAIQHGGEPRFVLMSVARFEHLVKIQDMRRHEED
ncbi:type II toxin-antitoxin system Phd/YefM family antitoxin [Paracoccus saliphilus]|uniref:Antitoxin Phd_YefM, type II toxin-antitoxin system n=1 Tax=Paracoccus saliphilus TaxID=405559 RepID=A0AA45W6J1_9RHOB|nr:type II toxin-antitoxin system Phd/YefM family antitoxin [Paracoccus saliphilus]WCR04385.1 type II toxin-antitoxin system Phd/YefM family antitoxin [Paracoccus saliphilus]SIT02067.1 Antitoxin Phd_YefM, type II toxin-antitoxin system [Paracoccus saliphilus]